MQRSAMRTVGVLGACGLVAMALGACGNDNPQGATGATTGAKPATSSSAAQTATAATSTATATSSSTASGSGTATAPATGDYPAGSLKLLDKDCSKPHALLASGPVKLGLEFPWPLPKQAFLAHPSFKIVKGEPAAAGEVRLGTHEVKDGYALVAKCKDAETCNKAAAMYKGVIRSSSPQLFCGTVPGVSAEPKDSGFEWSADITQNLPKKDETVGSCARLDACWISLDHNAPGDPFLECQKAPQTFKVDCAQKPTCQEVVKCMGK